MSRQAWDSDDGIQEEAAQNDVSASPSSQILVGGDVGGEDRVLETKTETRENEKEMKSKKKNKENRNS